MTLRGVARVYDYGNHLTPGLAEDATPLLEALSGGIVLPISLDSSLATLPGSRRKEARDVSEYGRAGLDEEPRKAERPAEAVERAAEGRGGVAASARGGHRRGEPGGSGRAAGAGTVAARVAGRGPAGPEGLKGKNRTGGQLMRTRAKLGEMTMRVELQSELLGKWGYGDELRKLLRRLDG